MWCLLFVALLSTLEVTPWPLGKSKATFQIIAHKQGNPLGKPGLLGVKLAYGI